MFSRRPRIGFSAPPIGSAQRHCYVSSSALDALLNTPGAIDSLLQELDYGTPASTSTIEGLERLRRIAIHLSVTPTPYYGLSLEEVVVLCAYQSERFALTAWRRQLMAQPSPAQLSSVCRRWLSERAEAIVTGGALGLPWPMVGYTPHEQPTTAAPGFVVGLAPIADAAAIDSELAALAGHVGFGHEHYLALSGSTALEYVKRAATSGRTLRWDPFALDRRLRTLGIGLLLVESDTVAIYLPARYQPVPASSLGLPLRRAD